MADGYGVGLFDSKGPTAFAASIKGIATELSSVQGAFTAFGSSAANSLGQISSAIENLTAKLSGLQQGVQQVQGAMGQPGRGMGGGAQPGAAPSPGGGSGGTGAAGLTIAGPGWTPSSEKPSAGNMQGQPLAGMEQDTAQPSAPTQGPKMQPGSAKAQRGFTWGAAAESILPAMAGKAIDFASGYGRGMISAAVQGATIGQMEAPAFGVSAKSMYVLPGGTLAQNAQDYAQANYYAMMNMGAAPGTQNWSTVQRGANQLMTMVPGMSRQGAMGAQNALQQAPVLNRAVALGMNFRPGGQMQTPEQIYGQVFNRLTMGQKIDAKTFEAMMQPGAPGAVNLAALGIEPGTDEYYGFMQYALTRLGMQKQGKVNAMGQGMPDVGTSKGAKQTPLGQTPYYSQLTAQSARSRIESQAEPALADAAKRLNDAAGELLSAATHLTGPLGELGNFITRLIPGPGGPGGLVGGALEVGAGLWAGKKLYGKFKGTGGKGGGLFGGLFKRMGKGGGAVTETEGAVEDAVAGGGKKGLLGGLADCFGCGGSGGMGNLFQGGGKLREMGTKATDWLKGGKAGGVRDILGKILGSDVSKEGEKLGMGKIEEQLAFEGEGFEKPGLWSRIATGGRSMGGKLSEMFKGGLGKLRGLGGRGGEQLAFEGMEKKGLGSMLKGGLGKLVGGAGAKGLLGGLAERGGLSLGLDALGLAGGPLGMLAMTGLTMFGPQLLHGAMGLGKKAIGGLEGLFKGQGGLLGGALGLAGGGLVGAGVGHMLGGLFHHKKKQTDNTSDDSDVAALKNPPKGSVLDVLLQKPPDRTMLAAATTPGQGQVGMGGPVQHKKGGLGGIFGSILGAIPGGAALASFFGGTPAAAQTMGTGGAPGGGGGAYGWGYVGLGGPGARDLSSLFANKGKQSQSSTGNSGNGGQGAASPGGGAGSDSGGPNLNGSGNVQQAYNYFLGKGLSDFQAAGVIGNLAQESGVNPQSNQSGGGPGRGIAQWTVDQRWTGVLALAKQRNKPPTDLGVQLDYMWQELTGGYSSALAGLKSSTDVTSATTIFEQKYEAAGTPAMQNRINFAKNVLASKGGHYARGSQRIAANQLAVLHKGEAVVPAADNYGTLPYNRNGAMGGGGAIINLNFKQGSIVLQVPPNSSQQDMDNMAKQFVAAISKPQLLNAVRTT